MSAVSARDVSRGEPPVAPARGQDRIKDKRTDAEKERRKHLAEAATQPPIKVTRKQRKAEEKIVKAQATLDKIHTKNMQKQAKAKVKAEKSARKALKKARKAQTRAEHSKENVPKRLQKALKAEQAAAVKAELASRRAELLATRAATYATTLPPAADVKGYNPPRPALTPAPASAPAAAQVVQPTLFPVTKHTSLLSITTANTLRPRASTMPNTPALSTARPSPTHSTSTLNTASPTTPTSTPIPAMPARTAHPPPILRSSRRSLPHVSLAADTDFLLSPDHGYPSASSATTSAFSSAFSVPPSPNSTPIPNRAVPPPLPKRRPHCEVPPPPPKTNLNLRTQAEGIVQDRRIQRELREREYHDLTRDLKTMQL
jgi:hypothetical protein